MKHLILSLFALLLSISCAFAGTHKVTIYQTDEILSVVDQTNKSYEFGKKQTVEDGTTLTLAVIDGCNKVITCIDDDGNEYATGGLSITIDEMMPEKLYITLKELTGYVYVNIPGICESENSLGIKLFIDGMPQDLQSYCSDEGGLVLNNLNAGAEISLTSNVPIDWKCDGNLIKSYDVTVGDETIVIGNEAWDADNYRWDLWERNSNSSRNISYVGRTMRGNMWNTICLPFDIDAEQVARNFQTVVEFINATYSESTGMEIECAPVTTMEANTPYLVMPNVDRREFSFNRVKVMTNAEGKFEAKTIAPAGSPVQFVGVLKPVTLYADDYSVLFVTAGNKVSYPNATANMKEFRAYFKIPEPLPASGRKAPARIVVRNRAEEPTGLNDNVMLQNNSKKYMQDGRLVIEINGVRYNAQGQTID